MTRVKITGPRSEIDEWYNTMVIQMDENDLALGRNNDGFIHYDWPWVGSGVEATEEAQGLIPPITGMETTSGAVEGSTVVTVYQEPAPETLDALIIPDGFTETASTQSAGAPASVNFGTTIVPPGGAGATQAAVLPSASATDPTPPTTEMYTGPTTTAAATVAPEALVFDTSGGSATVAGVDLPPTTPAPANGVVYSTDPLQLFEDPQLVIGGTTDGKIACLDETTEECDTNPINGGIILDGNATNTADGDAKLLNELSTDPGLAGAGSRMLPPFNCTGLTGYSCCLLIKHTVRDADVDNKAIQCFLEYAEGTVKAEVYNEKTSKKVMIQSDGNGFVRREPKIVGNWDGLQAGGYADKLARRL